MGGSNGAVGDNRAYGVQCWSFWQDLSQLKRTYPSEWPTLLNNAAALQVFGMRCMSAAIEACELIPSISPERLLTLCNDRQVLCLSGQPSLVAGRYSYVIPDLS